MRKTMLRTFLAFVVLLLGCASVFGQGTPGTVRFPGNLDTPDSLFRIKDAPRARLMNSITSSSSTINVDSTATFDISGSIKLDDEVIFYASKSATQFQGLTRGAAGTTATSHASGIVVRAPILAVHHNTLASSIVATQTKIGSGSSTPVNGAVLIGTGNGTSGWVSQPVIDCTNCTNLPSGGGSGDVVGPSVSSDGELPLFDLGTGKLLKRSNALNGYVKLTSGVVAAAPIPEADLPSGINAAKLADGSVSNAEYQFLDGAASNLQTQLNGKQAGPLTGDVITSGAAATISNDVVTNARLANMTPASIKGRASAGTGDPEDLTGTQTTALLDNFVGDSGSGGTKGLVPAPASGDTAANKFLKATGQWATIPGGGDMLLGTLQTVSAAKFFNDGTLAMNGGDYGPTDGSMPPGVEKSFFLNTNSSSKRLFFYQSGQFHALLQAGIDLVSAANGGTGDDTSSTTGLPRIAGGNWTYDAAASISETNAGTETNKAITPDALAGSNFGTRTAQLVVFDFTTDTATGDARDYFVVPAELNGMILVAVSAQVVTAGTTNTLNVDLARCAVVATGNMCSGTVVDILSTNLTIDSGENKSSTAAVAAVIDTANDDVATDQVIRVDVDAIHATAAKGLILTLSFRLP
jgi:hypothetical protein